MAEKNGIYKCELCGNIVSVIEVHDGTLVCCGQDMNLLEAKTTEQEGNEKHVPIINIDGNTVTIKVGSVDHPMTEEHHIELIEILGDGKVIASCRLNPGEKPEAEFKVKSTDGITARSLCNLHGLWMS